MIGILDLKICNLASVSSAIYKLGFDIKIVKIDKNKDLEQISHLIIILYQLFFIFSIWRLTFSIKIKDTFNLLIFNLIGAFSLSTFIIFMPETYAFSIGFLFSGIWFLIFINPIFESKKIRFLINPIVIGGISLVSINLLAIGIPYLMIPLLAIQMSRTSIIRWLRELKLRIIEMLISFLIALSPYFVIYFSGKSNEFIGYVNKWSSLENIFTIQAWLKSFINMFVFGFTSPVLYLKRHYQPDMIFSSIGLFSLFFGVFVFIIFSLSFLKSIKKVSIKSSANTLFEKDNYDQQIPIYSFLIVISQLIFFVFYAPRDSILFSSYISLLTLLSSIYFLDQININFKSFSWLKIVLTFLVSIYLCINLKTFLNSLTTPWPENCKDWGVINIVIPRK